MPVHEKPPAKPGDLYYYLIFLHFECNSKCRRRRGAFYLHRLKAAVDSTQWMVFLLQNLPQSVTINSHKQSRALCVKCRADGELPRGRKGQTLAVQSSHPAAAYWSFCNPPLCGNTILRRSFYAKKSKQQTLPHTIFR